MNSANYSYDELKFMANRQLENFKETSKGFGFEAKQAQAKVKELENLTESERIEKFKEDLLKFQK